MTRTRRPNVTQLEKDALLEAILEIQDDEAQLPPRWLHVPGVSARRYLSARCAVRQGRRQRGHHPAATAGVPATGSHLMALGSR